MVVKLYEFLEYVSVHYIKSGRLVANQGACALELDSNRIAVADQ